MTTLLNMTSGTMSMGLQDIPISHSVTYLGPFLTILTPTSAIQLSVLGFQDLLPQDLPIRGLSIGVKGICSLLKAMITGKLN